MNKRDLIIYRVVTVLFTAHMLFTVVAYFFMHDMVSEMFESLGVSPSIIYPLAIAKLIGLVVIWANKSRMLTNLAYLGFAVDFVLAVSFHLMAGDGGAIGALVALVILLASFIYNRRVYGVSKKSVELA